MEPDYFFWVSWFLLANVKQFHPNYS